MSEEEKEHTFSSKEILEELTTIYTERSEFLRTKMAKHSIGEIEANLYRYRLGRLKAAEAFVKAARNGKEPVSSAPFDTSAADKLKWFLKMQETAVELATMGKPVTGEALKTFIPSDAVPNPAALCDAVASSPAIVALMSALQTAKPPAAAAPVVEVIDDGFDDV
jgi:hypothetical protein